MERSEKIARILACPDCHSSLVREKNGFFCQTCARNFQVKDGVPVLFSRGSEELELAGTTA